MNDRYNILGVGVNVLNLRKATELIIEAVGENKKGYICHANVHSISEACNDLNFREILNRSFLTTPDGMPLVWLGRLLKDKSIGRVYGPDLFLSICKETANSEMGHFLYGGQPGIADHLSEVLREKFPGIRIVGTYCPPFRPLDEKEERDLVHEIQSLQPHFFWVGLGAPKQEIFMSEYIDKLDTRLMFGVGAAFDFITGRVKQAPAWMQKFGLEWLYRLCCEPRRLWKRYLTTNPLFIIRTIAQLAGIRKYPDPNIPPSSH